MTNNNKSKKRSHDERGRFTPGNTCAVKHKLYTHKIPVSARREANQRIGGLIEQRGGVDLLSTAEFVIIERCYFVLSAVLTLEKYGIESGRTEA